MSEPQPLDATAVLLDAIKASPADDLPRLAYADLLEEAGGLERLARAAFIRDQIATESLLAEKEDARHALEVLNDPWATDVLGLARIDERLDRLRDRQQRWLEACAHAAVAGDWVHRPMTFSAFWDIATAAPGVNALFWRRGWVVRANCTLSAWLAHGKEVVRSHPVEAVLVNDVRIEPVWPGSGLFRLIAADVDMPVLLQRWRLSANFPRTEEIANRAALHHACLEWARHDD